MSPILVRPLREQLEHDRVIRLLQAKYRRKFEVAINPGNEQTAPVETGTTASYPDLVLQSSERGHKLLGVVEVETAESVNNLEAMSQWAAFARLQAPFHLYIPVSSVDVARRLCLDLHIPVAEIWVYHAIGDQMRFTLVQRTEAQEEPKPRAPATPAASSRTPAASRVARPGGGARTRSARPVSTRVGARAPAAGANGRRPATGKAKGAATRQSGKVEARKSAASAGTKAPKRR